MLVLLSLFFIIVENNLPIGGMLICVSLPFLTYLINTRKNFFYLFLVYFLLASQTDKYFLIFAIMFCYLALVFFLASYIEYNRNCIIYYLPVQLLTYYLLTYNFLTMQYFIINAIGLLIFNYFYIKYVEFKVNK